MGGEGGGENERGVIIITVSAQYHNNEKENRFLCLGDGGSYM